MKATSRWYASGMLSAVIVASALVLPTTTLAAPGEWTSTYDWQASPTTGFGGWGTFETYAVGPGGYYTAFQNGPLGLGLSMRPTGGRIYSNANPDSEVGGPKQVWQLNAPGTTRIRQGTFDHVDYAGTGERQFLRLALYGDDIEDTKYDYTPPNVNDDGPRVVARPPFQPGARDAQLWLYTSCPKDPPSAPAACPFVPNPSNSKGRVGKVVLDLTDPEPPAINVTGPLTSGGWSQGRGSGGAQVVATDPGSGIENVRLTATEPGRPPRLVSSQNASCDPGHTQPKPSGREAAICPDSYTTDATDRPAQLREGETTYTATATDLSQRTASRSFTVRIDRTRPTRLSATGPLTRFLRKWTNTRRSSTLIAGASDARSGVARLELRAGSAVLAAKDHPCANGSRACPKRWSTPLAVDLGRLREGRHRLTLRAVDLAGNATSPRSLGELLIDRTAPTAPRGQVQVASNGTTARWTSYDRASRLDFFRVRIERPSGRVAFRSVRPSDGGGRESTTRTGRIFQPGVKAASITVTAHDRAGNTAAARIRCKAPYRLEYCAKQRRTKARKKKAARRQTRRRLSRTCRVAYANFVRSTEAWGMAAARYKDLTERRERASKAALRAVLDLRGAARRYETRATNQSTVAVTLAKDYRRAKARFERAADEEQELRKKARSARRTQDRLVIKQKASARGDSSIRAKRSCRYLSPSQARRLDAGRARWNAGVGRTNKGSREARSARKRISKQLASVAQIRRQAVTARGRGLLKTTDAIAQTYQPILHVDRSDGFWPVRFDTIYDFRRKTNRPPSGVNPPAGVPPGTRSGFPQTCIKDSNDGRDCSPGSTRRQLAQDGKKNLFLDYPAPSDSRSAQADMLERAAGGYAQKPAMYYFKTLGEQRRDGYRHSAIQYWFFYSFNYQTDNVGRHEGDFEHVAIVLSRETGLPRYVFMARHDKDESKRQKEPMRYRYDALQNPRGLRHDGAHVKVWAAKGSHASYPRCDRWDRVESGFGRDRGIPDDYTCKDGGPVRRFGTSTPLFDLGRAPWSCWQGRFGEKGPRGRAPVIDQDIDSNGPEAPLRQQEEYYVAAEPCATGTPDSGPLPAQARSARSSASDPTAPLGALPGESSLSLEDEVLDEAAVSDSALRASQAAGAHYDEYFDSCDDWQTPPESPGTKLVACDQRVLTRYFQGGLEDPGPEGLRISDPRSGPVAPDPGVPSVFETADPEQASRATISASRSVSPAVFAARTTTDGSVAAVRFASVPLTPGASLRVRTGRTEWRLIDERGRTVARSQPRIQEPLPPRPQRVRARRTGRTIAVSWRAPTGARRFSIYAVKANGSLGPRLGAVRARKRGTRYRRSVRARWPVTRLRVIAERGGRLHRSSVVRVRK